MSKSAWNQLTVVASVLACILLSLSAWGQGPASGVQCKGCFATASASPPPSGDTGLQTICGTNGQLRLTMTIDSALDGICILDEPATGCRADGPCRFWTTLRYMSRNCKPKITASGCGYPPVTFGPLADSPFLVPVQGATSLRTDLLCDDSCRLMYVGRCSACPNSTLTVSATLACSDCAPI